MTNFFTCICSQSIYNGSMIGDHKGSLVAIIYVKNIILQNNHLNELLKRRN